MCKYIEAIVRQSDCGNDTKHEVKHRYYTRCAHPNPQGVQSTYNHCGDEFAEHSTGAVFGSSYRGGPCEVCQNPSNALKIVSSPTISTMQDRIDKGTDIPQLKMF